MKRLLVMVSVMAGCKGGSKAEDPPAAVAPAPPPVAPRVTPIVDAGQPAPDPPDAALPKAFDYKAVLGKSPAEVAKVLTRRGRDAPVKNNDGVTYDLPEALIRVEFAGGKAVMLAITMHKLLATDSDRIDALAVAGAPWESDWTSDGDAPGGDSGLQLWDEAEHARANERHRVGQLIGNYLEQDNGTLASAHYQAMTTLDVMMAGGCTRANLAAVKKNVEADLNVDLAALGFERLQCGADGAVLKLR